MSFLRKGIGQLQTAVQAENFLPPVNGGAGAQSINIKLPDIGKEGRQAAAFFPCLFLRVRVGQFGETLQIDRLHRQAVNNGRKRQIGQRIDFQVYIRHGQKRAFGIRQFHRRDHDMMPADALQPQRHLHIIRGGKTRDVALQKTQALVRLQKEHAADGKAEQQRRHR